jgi:hypothetical protein
VRGRSEITHNIFLNLQVQHIEMKNIFNSDPKHTTMQVMPLDDELEEE